MPVDQTTIVAPAIGDRGGTYNSRVSTMVTRLSELQSLANGQPYNVKDSAYGATGDGVTDDTTAIQAALTAAAVAGGVVFLPVGTYVVSSTLTLGTLSAGVRIIGSGATWGVGSGGTIIKWTGTGPLLNVPGCAQWEIAHLCIDGQSTGVDGIRLTKSGSTVARMGSIHHCIIRNCTGSGLMLDQFSYVHIHDMFVDDNAIGCEFRVLTTNTLSEFLWMTHCEFGGNSTAGMQMEAGSYLYLDNVVLANVNKNLYIHRPSGGTGLFNVYFNNLECDSGSAASHVNVEMYAEYDYITRFWFTNTSLYMMGTNAGQKAIYLHGAGGYTLDTIEFDGLHLNLGGATPPTTSIDCTGAADAAKAGTVKFLRTNDSTGGAFVGDYVSWPDMIGFAAPTTGTWGTGMRVWNVDPTSGSDAGWICVAEGSPGTWEGFGAMGATQKLSGWAADNAQNPSLGTLPANSYVTAVHIHVTEAFNSSGTDEITVGYDASSNAFATAVDVSTTGIKTVTLGASAGFNATSRAVEAYYVNGGTEPTTGKALVTLEFCRVAAEPA